MQRFGRSGSKTSGGQLKTWVFADCSISDSFRTVLAVWWADSNGFRNWNKNPNPTGVVRHFAFNWCAADCVSKCEGIVLDHGGESIENWKCEVGFRSS